MAQRPIILGLGPRKKGNFVAIFKVIEALQFIFFLTPHIYSPDYWNINDSDFSIEFIGFINLQISKNGKGLDLGHYFLIGFLWLL